MGHYPAIDVLQSISRLASRVASEQQKEAAQRVREAMTLLQSSEDLIRIGAYASGTNPHLDQAIRQETYIRALLRQRPEESTPLSETVDRLRRLADAQ